ncbi:unnamed protein product [Fraxinus pennsylvanica]|uniref:Uncharacterized protein n=1 Tax=Fraxinus pennsylvanica TaxID=56036 RepID=A0AAD1YRX6_9LAMI|nr:unnamed protein product [Fraxinus pennsylvanica]
MKRYEDNSNPEIHALKAYLALHLLLRGQKLVQKSILKIVSIVGRRYKELGIWSSKIGFSGKNEEKGSGVIGAYSMNKLGSLVNWPGKSDRVPSGLAAPLKTGVPGKISNPAFVKVEWVEKTNEMKYEANRSRYVEFSQPFSVSGLSLSMLVPAKIDPHRAWIFVMPFIRDMWIYALANLLYMMFFIWLMEHQSNPLIQNLGGHGKINLELRCGPVVHIQFSLLCS